ncbi:alpha/beta hydrolase [Methylobacterium currus]|nr:alpha/beta hydrolase [Methylobacterium currus]UHC19466.1 alpha/beta hydrolase [Methylobacterium currus]
MASRTIRTRGADLLIDDAGQTEPALVLLHYWGGSARTWDAVISHLPITGRKVVINQRGWGGSRALDGRYDLDALSDDIVDTVTALGIRQYIVVGHSMGGKVAQLLAGRRPLGLAGMVLVAPAPPTPMQVPPAVRAGMLASYQSRGGVLEALQVLSGSALDDACREQVIRDTLSGDAGAKRYWPDHGMTVDITAALTGLEVPVEIVLAEHDQVERGAILKPIFAEHLPSATITTISGIGHLVPLEAPGEIASSCERMIDRVRLIRRVDLDAFIDAMPASREAS